MEGARTRKPTYDELTAEIARLRQQTEEYRETLASSMMKGVSEVLKWGWSLTQILQTGRMLTWEWDPRTDEVSHSANAAEILGARCSSGKEFFSLIHPEDRPRVIEALRESIEHRKPYAPEFRIVRKTDGSVRWIEDRGHLVVDPGGNVVRIGGICLDITEQRQYERALQRSNEQLEEFAHIVAHDLKAPLRTLFGFADILHSRYSHQLDSEADEFLDFLRDSAIRMSSLIDTILAYSTVTREAPELVTVDCGAIVEETLRLIQWDIEASHAEIKVYGLPTVKGDTTQLGRLFQNLINNAIKFRADRTPRIVISAERGVHEWIFTVEDNGIGVERDYLDRVFDLFERAGATGGTRGTGIGLAVCKRVVENHGGRIWVESTPGIGSRFIFTLPREPRENEEVA